MSSSNEKFKNKMHGKFSNTRNFNFKNFNVMIFINVFPFHIEIFNF
jgi:hypothetical protein